MVDSCALAAEALECRRIRKRYSKSQGKVRTGSQRQDGVQPGTQARYANAGCPHKKYAEGQPLDDAHSRGTVTISGMLPLTQNPKSCRQSKALLRKITLGMIEVSIDISHS